MTERVLSLLGDTAKPGDEIAPVGTSPPDHLVYAISDPGMFVRRGYEIVDGEKWYESLQRWQARAVAAAQARHEEQRPVIAYRWTREDGQQFTLDPAQVEIVR